MLDLFAAGLGALALLAAIGAPYWHDRELRKAFRKVEDDFDDLHDEWQRHLGRVSRLKRSTIQTLATSPLSSGASSTPGDGGVAGAEKERSGPLPAKLTRSQLYAEYLRRVRVSPSNGPNDG